MPDTRTFIRNLVVTATDLDPSMRANLLHCLETKRLPIYQVAGPLYVNQSEAAELMGVGRTKFPEVAAFRGIELHEMTPGWFQYFTPDLIVHQSKEIQVSTIGVSFNPPTKLAKQSSSSLDAA